MSDDTDSGWRIHARRVIAQAFADGRAVGETPEQLRARVDAAYPYGQRANWPYKCWLKERGEAFCREGVATDAERELYGDKPIVPEMNPAEAGTQLTLF